MKRFAAAGLLVLWLFALCACAGPAEPVTDAPKGAEVQLPEEHAPAEQETPAVTGEPAPYTLTRPEMQSVDFWLALADEPERVRMTPEEIRTYNAGVLQTDGTETWDLEAFPEILSAAELQGLIGIYPEMPDSAMFTMEGRVTNDQRLEIRKNRAIDAVKAENPAEFGFLTENIILRTYPSALPLFKTADSTEYDRAAETALKLWEPVRVLHTSADGGWKLICAYDYLGWAPADSVALCSRNRWDELRGQLRESFLTVTAPRLAADGSFSHPELNGLVLTMGTRLPLAAGEVSADNASAENCHIVLLPLRNADGTLQTVTHRIPADGDSVPGALPYTTENVLRQGFRLLGHRYGWGGTAGGWDCSSLCQDIYRTMGFDLPRNANAQLCLAGTLAADRCPAEQKQRILESMLPGAMLELPGHQTMYIGSYGGEGYVLHATHGVAAPDGSFYEANSVIVTSVEALRSSGKTLLEEFRGFALPGRDRNKAE